MKILIRSGKESNAFLWRIKSLRGKLIASKGMRCLWKDINAPEGIEMLVKEIKYLLKGSKRFKVI